MAVSFHLNGAALGGPQVAGVIGSTGEAGLADTAAKCSPAGLQAGKNRALVEERKTFRKLFFLPSGANGLSSPLPMPSIWHHDQQRMGSHGVGDRLRQLDPVDHRPRR